MNQTDEAAIREFQRALLRFNSHVLGLVIGILASVGLFVGTIVLILRSQDEPGDMLRLLRHFFPGYTVSLFGAVIGSVWAGLAGYILGSVFARAYGPWVLRRPPHPTAPVGHQDDTHLGIALLPAIPVGITSGLLVAAGLFAATNWIYMNSHGNSPHLALLSNYLPGFTPDPLGGLIGACWIFLYGSVGAGLVAWVYNRVTLLRHPPPS